MRTLFLAALLTGLALAGLSGARGAAHAAARDGGHGSTPHPDVHLFAHSRDCVSCHNQLTAPDGRDISIGTAWRGTMMANSGRDPYWQASVRRETLDHPAHGAAIEDECAGCHMPMSTRATRAGGGSGAVFAHLPVNQAHPSALRELAADGVSCTVCHQIGPDGLGTRASFNGGFQLAAADARGVRPLFGPFAVDAGRRRIMHSVTGFTQAEGAHLRQSELCASCHTLITEAYGADGRVVGALPEQMNYQEWQQSAFPAEGRSCQSCHMPAVAGPVRISSVLGEPRETLARHAFVGGNTVMLGLLERFREVLGVAASPAELSTTREATARQLREDTATMTVSTPVEVDGHVRFTVEVTNRSGHKFPTGYPARRAWLHVTVTDARGATVFESGAPGADGAIHGNDGDEDAGRFEPHYARITQADQVQIYESILGDPAGRPTTGLLTAIRYLKDNRLLPRGFDKDTAPADVAVYGEAGQDGDFMGGGDRVAYDVPATGAGLSVAVELRYQPIGFRWAKTLAGYRAPESDRFAGYYAAMAGEASVVVARWTSR